MQPSSPCVKLCRIDHASGLCHGCGRTLDEIARWGAISEEERIAVMAALPARLRPRGDGSLMVRGLDAAAADP